MASHNQFDAAPSVAPDIVPVAAPATTQVGVAPDAVPAAAPVAAPHAARRVARGGARLAARGVPQRRAHHVAHVPAPGAALGGGGPIVAPGEAPIPGQAIPIGGPATPPPRIDIDAIFAFSEQEIARLQHPISTSDDSLYRDTCTMICRSLHDLTARF